MNPLYLTPVLFLSFLILNAPPARADETKEQSKYTVYELPAKEGEKPKRTALPITDADAAEASGRFYQAIAAKVPVEGQTPWDPAADKFYAAFSKSDHFLNGAHEAVVKDGKVVGIRISNGDKVLEYSPPNPFVTHLPEKEGGPVYVQMLDKDKGKLGMLYNLSELQKTHPQIAALAAANSAFMKNNASRNKLARFEPGKFFDGSAPAPGRDPTVVSGDKGAPGVQPGFPDPKKLAIGNAMGSKLPADAAARKAAIEAMRAKRANHYWDGKILYRLGEGEDKAVGYKARGEIGANTKGVLFYHGNAAPEADGSHPDWEKNWALYGIPSDAADIKEPRLISAYKDLELEGGITSEKIEETMTPSGRKVTQKRALDLPKIFVENEVFDKGGEKGDPPTVRLARLKAGSGVTASAYRDDLGREYQRDGQGKPIKRKWDRGRAIPLPGEKKEPVVVEEEKDKDPDEPDTAGADKEKPKPDPVVAVEAAADQIKASLGKARDIVSALQTKLEAKFTSDDSLAREIKNREEASKELLFAAADVDALHTLAANADASPEERKAALRILGQIAYVGKKTGTEKRREKILDFMEARLKPDSAASADERKTIIAELARLGKGYKGVRERISGTLAAHIKGAENPTADIESAAASLLALGDYGAIDDILKTPSSPGAVALAFSLHKDLDALNSPLPAPVAATKVTGSGRSRKTTTIPVTSQQLAEYAVKKAERDRLRETALTVRKALQTTWRTGATPEIKERAAKALIDMEKTGGYDVVTSVIKSGNGDEATLLATFKALTPAKGFSLGGKNPPSAKRVKFNESVLAALADTRSPAVRKAAADALSWQGENGAFTVAPIKILGLLETEKDPAVRASLTAALGKNFGNPKNPLVEKHWYGDSISPPDPRIAAGMGALRERAVNQLISQASSGDLEAAKQIGNVIHAHESDERLFKLMHLALSPKYGKTHPEAAAALRAALSIDADGKPVVGTGIYARYLSESKKTTTSGTGRGRRTRTGEQTHYYMYSLGLYQERLAKMTAAAKSAQDVNTNFEANVGYHYKQWLASQK